MLRIVLAALALTACDPGDIFKEKPGQGVALEIIRDAFSDSGLDIQPTVYIVWYDHSACLADTPFAHAPEGACRTGRALPLLDRVCWVELLWTNRLVRWDPSVRLSETSLVHELLHCALWRDLGDPKHESFLWRTLVPATQKSLAQVGL